VHRRIDAAGAQVGSDPVANGVGVPVDEAAVGAPVEQGQQCRVDRHEAILAALAVADGEHRRAGVQRQVGAGDVGDLAAAQPGEAASEAP
jgi:hypothetical protein